eukprot:1491591-Ditylum_brightwellii.AAC.1
MKYVLVANIDVDIVTSTSELDYYVIQKEQFKPSVDDYNSILDEISRRVTVDFELGCSDEIDPNKI